MDPIATLLLARTRTVVLDPDHTASAATRPARDADIDRFEDELLQLGFVMSLDLAMTLRRMPHQTLVELKSWIVDTLARSLAQRPHVPLARGWPADTYGRHVLRAITWLRTQPVQPCPWCARSTAVGALEPCGHLVCRPCWSGGTFAGCPICHRRVAPDEPFIRWPETPGDRVEHHAGELAILHLAFDVSQVAQHRIAHLLARPTPLADADRAELEAVIDALGPRVAGWLPARIPVRTTMAIALARLWITAPDRVAMMSATHGHIETATDVLRIAAVLLQGNAALAVPMRLRSIPRSLRRAVLEALERLPAEPLIEDMRRYRALWKRIGERLHPGELAAQLPNVAAAFAAVRDKPAQITWGGRVEAALAAGDARAAALLLGQRPGELLRRIDHLARVAAARQPDAIDDVLAALRAAARAGAPAALLQLAAHVGQRAAPASRRVVFPHGDVRRPFVLPDVRAPLGADVIAAIVDAARGELVARAAARRNFARAVIDRGLAALPVRALGVAEVTASRATLWDLAAIHAAARANTIYARDGDAIAIYKRRDGETHLARLHRLEAGDHDRLSKIPPAAAPTWFAVVREDVALPRGSDGYAHERGAADGITRRTAAELVAELGARP